jgi:four helix bundle protein
LAKGDGLVEHIHRDTAPFPREELYGLTCQMRRAAISIPSNIAEGQRRHTTKEFLRFLSTANGSLAELETQLLVSERLTYIKSTKTRELLDSANEIGRLLNGLSRALQQHNQRSTDPED